MAESSSSQEKTEDATPRRLREARKKGQGPKSRDISQVFVFLIAFMIIAFTFASMGGELKAYFTTCFEILSEKKIDGGAIWHLGKEGVILMGKVLAPPLLAGVVMALLTGFAQVGGIFSTDPLTPKFERLNPIEGLKNMFKAVTFIELLKNMAKIAAVFYLAYITIFKSLGKVMHTMQNDDMYWSAKMTGGLIFDFILKVGIVFVLLSVLDYAIQRWNFMKNMRMTKEEVKREYKQDEGDPAIKGERRRIHREMVFGDVKQAVKKSDVVITNPIHVACVLEYKKEEMGTPILTMKGQERIAQMIVQIAQEEGIPVIRNIPLAWALLPLEIDDEIPEDLYDTVAEVLAMVYEMKQKMSA